MSDKTEVHVRSGGGCLGTILLVIVAWALLFGVTVDGKHYGMSCSCERGVGIDY